MDTVGSPADLRQNTDEVWDVMLALFISPFLPQRSKRRESVRQLFLAVFKTPSDPEVPYNSVLSLSLSLCSSFDHHPQTTVSRRGIS